MLNLEPLRVLFLAVTPQMNQTLKYDLSNHFPKGLWLHFNAFQTLQLTFSRLYVKFVP